MKLIYLGPPGVGKGTIAKLTVEKYGIPQISTGDLFRENISKETELGKKAKEYIDKGGLVPDEVTVGMVKERLSRDDCKNGYILDGFPRTIPQADALEGFEKIDKVINFVAPDELIIKRLASRRTCKACGAIYNLVTVPPKEEGKCDKCGEELFQREDDNEETVKKRLETYKEQTEPLIAYYKEKGMIADVSGEGNPDSISADAFKVIETLA